MEVADVVVARRRSTATTSTRARRVAASDPDPNATLRALQHRFPDPPVWTVAGTVPFSSARKWSAMSFDGHGTWVLGAPEIVLGDAYDGAR